MSAFLAGLALANAVAKLVPTVAGKVLVWRLERSLR